jgi:hypothetical protein
VHLTLALRTVIRANTALSVSLVLDEALPSIVHETCTIINCDRVYRFS